MTSVHRGILYMLLASLAFAGMSAFAKFLSPAIPSVELVFFRNSLGVLFVLGSLWKRPPVQTGGRPFLLAFRGLMGTLALMALFYNLTLIPLGDAITFSQTAPIFIAIFAFVLLRERLRLFTWLAVLSGFLGIIFILKPTGHFSPASLFFGIFSGMGAALAYTSIRRLHRHYDSRVIVLSFMLSGILLPLLLMFVARWFHPHNFDFILTPFVVPKLQEWPFLIFLGVTALFLQLFITKAYSETKAGVVAVAGYSQIPFAILLGLSLGDSLPDPLTVLGMFIIVISGVVVSREVKV